MHALTQNAGKKRTLDVSGEGPNKRLKQSAHILPVQQLPFELIQQILLLLDNSSLLRFEMTNKSWEKSLIPIWKAKKISDRFDCEWKMARSESSPDKWDYVLSCALHKYIVIEKIPKINNFDLAIAQSVYRKYGGLMKKFPAFGEYIKEDIKRLGHIELNYNDTIVKQKFAEAVLEDYPGELVLQGLTATSRSIFGTTHYEYFKRALKKNAVFASQLFLELSFSFNSDSFKDMQFELAMEAAIRNDTNSLSQLINKYSLNELVSFAEKKYKLNRWEEANALFDYILIENKKPSIELLTSVAFTKSKLNKWTECDKLYTHLLAECSQSAVEKILSYGILRFAAFTKFRLRQWGEADILYTQALSAYKENASASTLSHAAQVKLKLEHWEKADNLFKRALDAYGENPSGACLSKAAFVKLKLKQFKDAIILSDQALLIYGQNAPKQVLTNLQSAKRLLQKELNVKSGA